MNWHQILTYVSIIAMLLLYWAAATGYLPRILRSLFLSSVLGAANVDPIYTKASDIQWNSYIVTANTTADLTSGTTYLVFTADATNGGFLSRLKFKPTPAGNTTATVARIWINNGSTTGTATNNNLFDDVSLPAITASGTASVNGVDYPINFPLPASYRVYVTIHTGSANGWACTAVGGKY